jgi:hypothetical protein
MDPVTPTTKSSSDPRKLPFRILTEIHDDHERTKRTGHRALTLITWLAAYLQDRMHDNVVGILLNLTPREVQNLKSCIRQVLELRIVPHLVSKILQVIEQRNSSGDEGTQMERHIHQCKLYDLLRPSYAFLVSLEFPDLFKEPASYREFREEWNPNEYGRYSIVPCAIRRDILVRLIDARVEKMKKRDFDNIRRNFTTNPISSNKRRASTSETDDTPSK